MFEFRLLNDKRLVAALEALPRAAVNEVLRPVVRAAAATMAKPIKASLKAMADRTTKRTKGIHLYQTVGVRVKTKKIKTGRMKWHAHLKTMVNDYDTAVVGTVGPLYEKGGFHRQPLEKGHRIVVGGTVARKDGRTAAIYTPTRKYIEQEYKGRSSKYRRMRKEGRKRLVAVGQRGGGRVTGQVKPYPFLRPAFQASQGAVMSTMQSKMADGVMREARKHLGGI
jgi:hypothetical protein